MASAWATEGGAISALEEFVSRPRHGGTIRALVGIHGNATTPTALKTLRRIAELRLADATPMFHPKVYIFHTGEGRAIAWVGSANCTGRGFESNEEVMLEVSATKAINCWFDKLWQRSGVLDEVAFDSYIANYRQPDKSFDQRKPVVDDQDPFPSRVGLVQVFFKSRGMTRARRYEGECTFVYADGSRRVHRYPSHASAVTLVLSTLSDGCRDDMYLSKLAQSDAFAGGFLLSRSQSDVKARPEDSVYAREVIKGCGWWLSQDTGSAQKFDLIAAAASLGGVDVSTDKHSKYGF